MSDTTTPRAHHPAKCPKCAHPVLIYSDTITLILSVRQHLLRRGIPLQRAYVLGGRVVRAGIRKEFTHRASTRHRRRWCRSGGAPAMSCTYVTVTGTRSGISAAGLFRGARLASSGDRGWTESGLKGPIWVIWRGRQQALLMLARVPAMMLRDHRQWKDGLRRVDIAHHRAAPTKIAAVVLAEQQLPGKTASSGGCSRSTILSFPQPAPPRYSWTRTALRPRPGTQP
jgi:hypothetical protein